MSVVSIHGEPSSLANNGDLVEQLEELLERARAGSITASVALSFRGFGVFIFALRVEGQGSPCTKI